MNVLVTGASSPIGEKVVQRLLRDSRVSHILAVADKGVPFSIPENPRITLTEIKFKSQRQLHTLLFGLALKKSVQVVIHTSQAESANREGDSVHAHNVESLRALVKFSERHPTIRRLVIRSSGAVYQVQRDLPALISEDHPLNMAAGAPQWVRDRVEADFTACARMGLSTLQVVVLRMAEILASGCGSQMYDYLDSSLCLRPIGFDPMLNFLSLEDAAQAFQHATHTSEQGVFNIPGADTLPLTEVISLWGRPSVAMPEPGIYWMYKVRQHLRGGQFRYGMNRRRFHYPGILDGRRAMDVLRYVPSQSVSWPDVKE
jgi:UDP-glucose 4-epimerase